mgnify:CR=1 FL=1
MGFITLNIKVTVNFSLKTKQPSQKFQKGIMINQNHKIAHILYLQLLVKEQQKQVQSTVDLDQFRTQEVTIIQIKQT